MSAQPSSRQAVRTIALIGNPNTGKTTLFNVLTGLSQRVGNYPGVTVERKIGQLRREGRQPLEILDLPGTYSLAAHSPDELIAVDVLLGQQQGAPPVDAVLAIVDASNLRRNFYLVSQLIETGLPLVIALNMSDVAQARGIRIDAARIQERLGVPVLPICAHRRQGLDALRLALENLAEGQVEVARTRPLLPDSLQRQAALLEGRTRPDGPPLSAVEALRALVDAGSQAEQRLLQSLGPGFAAELEELRRRADGPAPLSAQESRARYQWIDQVLADCLSAPTELRASTSDRIDRVLTHRVYGTLVFLGINALVFQAIYAWAAPLMDAIESLFGLLGERVGALLPAGALRSLLVDGIVAGVGGVLVFLPQIAILFFFISLLEDCGYMARAALLMDRLLTRCGLSGKSFIPLLSSFACAVPGIMAARTIEDRRDRFATILVAPLMSCSARLPVYTLLIAAFIPDRALFGPIGLQGLTLLAMYCLGVVVAIPVAWLLKKTLLRGRTPPFLLELPSYKWPGPAAVLLRVYHNGHAFVVRAGSIILATTVVMWALAYFPRSAEVAEHYAAERQQVEETLQGAALQLALDALDSQQAAAQLESSYLGRAGHFIAPIVRPLGWDWRIGMATLASFPAREVVISVLGTIYSLGGEQDEQSADLRQTMKESTWPDGSPIFTVPVALSIMVFFALCAQCASTLVAILRETRSWTWPLFSFAYMTALAYAGALLIYQLGNWLGWGA